VLANRMTADIGQEQLFQGIAEALDRSADRQPFNRDDVLHHLKARLGLRPHQPELDHLRPPACLVGDDTKKVAYLHAKSGFLDDLASRAGDGPSLIECLTYRYSGHSRADPAKYRPEGELERWKERDPIKIYRERLQQFGIKDDIIVGIETEVKRQVDDATEKCKAAPPPSLDILTTDVYADGGFAWRN